MATLSLNLKEEVILALTVLSKETGRSRSFYANEAISNYLKDKAEDFEDYKTAEKAWKEFKASGEKGTSAEDVFKKLGI